MIPLLTRASCLDGFLRDERHGPDSQKRLRAAYDAGAIIVCDTVYAELVPAFGNRAAPDAALRSIKVNVDTISASIAYEAGLRWMYYRRAGGPRTRIISDFLIGAHTLAAADVFLTRDRGLYATYFPELTTS